MDSPLASPRTRAQAAREMVQIAVDTATDQEIVAVQERLGAWLLEKVLDAAQRTDPDRPAAAKPAPSAPQRLPARSGGVIDAARATALAAALQASGASAPGIARSAGLNPSTVRRAMAGRPVQPQIAETLDLWLATQPDTVTEG